MPINYQIEKQFTRHTSEYAYGIARIAANNATEALLSNKKKQLNTLVSNVAKNPFIQSATIFTKDGQAVTQSPEPAVAIKTTTQKSSEDKLPKTIDERNKPASPALREQAKHNQYTQNPAPFFEKIMHQEKTIGWFKILLNKSLLELNFRRSLKESFQYIALITTLLLCVLFFIMLRYAKNVKKLTAACDQLIQTSAQRLPQNKEDWLSTFEALAHTKLQSLSAYPQLPAETRHWSRSTPTEDTVFCHCKFSMLEQDNEQSAEVLSLAEEYLKAAVQTYGVQSQGNILSGCLIPFLDTTSSREAVFEAVNLVELIRELFASLPLSISMRALIGKGPMLILENERATITGISLSNRLLQKIHWLEARSTFEEIITMGIAESDIQELAQFKEMPHQSAKLNQTLLQITSVNQAIKQQVDRKVNYLINLN